MTTSIEVTQRIDLEMDKLLAKMVTIPEDKKIVSLTRIYEAILAEMDAIQENKKQKQRGIECR